MAESKQSPDEYKRLSNAKITPQLLNNALKNFLSEIITKSSTNSSVACFVEPLIMRHASQIHKLFPGTRFLMLEDSEHTICSLIRAGVATIRGYSYKDYMTCMHKAYFILRNMRRICTHLGIHKCISYS